LPGHACPSRLCSTSGAGDSIGTFLDGFPSVSREQVIGVLTALKREANKLAAGAT
jgi:hypothetical protein